jgi:hypothetical protein
MSYNPISFVANRDKIETKPATAAKPVHNF